MLYGNYPATVDAKGRLKIPSALRAELDEAHGPEFFVTSINDGKSVRIFPLPTWKGIAEKLAQPPTFSKSKKKLVDQTNYWGQVVKMDGQGRILVPAKLRESAAMRGEVAVLGQPNGIEVWNDERLREHIKSQALTDEDLENLSNLGI